MTAPTLLIVGGRDEVVLDLNRRAQAELRRKKDLAVVPGATHPFQEPGTLATAAGLAQAAAAGWRRPGGRVLRDALGPAAGPRARAWPGAACCGPGNMPGSVEVCVKWRCGNRDQHELTS